MTNSNIKKWKSFSEFYPFYLNEHKNKTCRQMHFIGSCLVLLILLNIILTGTWTLLVWMPIVGYGFAWIGHFVFEKNRPATFIYPIYSFMGDWVMFKDIVTGKIKLF